MDPADMPNAEENGIVELEVDIAIIERIIREFKNEKEVHVINVAYQPVGAKGENYTSVVNRLLVTYKVDNGDNGEKYVVPLFMKHMYEKENEVLNRWCEVAYKNETAAIMGPLRRMATMMTATYIPRLLHYSQEKPLFAIMEDLTSVGYTLASRAIGLDFAHALLAIRSIAEFHASSVAIREENPDYWRQFTLTESSGDMDVFFVNGLKSLAATVSQWPELGPLYEEKLKKLSESVIQKIRTVYCRHNDEFNVLNHGDYSQLNVMFTHNAAKEPVSVALVDFQLTYYNSPVVDLLTLISTSTHQDVYVHHQQTLLEEYHSVLSTTMSRLACITEPPSLEELRRMYDARQFIAVVGSCTMYPLIRTRAENVVPVDTLIFGNSAADPRYLNDHVRELLTARLIDFDRRGLLDA